MSLTITPCPRPVVSGLRHHFRHGHAATILSICGVAALYVLAAWLGLMHAVVGNTVTVIWAPSGIALAALLVGGPRLAVGVLIGAFLANLLTGVPWGVAAGIAVGNTLAALAGTRMLEGTRQFCPSLGGRREVAALITLGAMLSTAISASVGTTILTVAGLSAADSYLSIWLKWWLGDMLGVLLVTPPLLILLHQSYVLPPLRRLGEFLALLATLVSVTYLVFIQQGQGGGGYYPAALAVFPAIGWVALRFGQLETSLSTLLVAVFAVWSTQRGLGPLAGASPVDDLVRWCVFANLLSIGGLLLAAFSTEHRRALGELQHSRDELERRVIERTAALGSINAALTREINERRRLEAELVRASEEQQMAIGRELHDGVGQYLTSLALFGAALLQRLRQTQHPEAQAVQRLVDMLDRAVDMVRCTSRGLYPASLDSDGLVAALGELARQTEAMETVSCSFRATGSLQVPDSLAAINLYRIAQQAINNAIRHGGARHLRIDLAGRGIHQCLSIRDDGVGCTVEDLRHTAGIGLHSMGYRAGLLGGTFSIRSNKRGGMTVRVLYTPTVEPPLP